MVYLVCVRVVVYACARIAKLLVLLGVLGVVMPAEYAAFGYLGMSNERMENRFGVATQRW